VSREVWVFRNGEVIPKHIAPPLHVKHAQSAYVIGDSLDYVQNMADGKRYSSKSAYYKAVRAAGCEIVGNENPSNGVSERASLPDPIHDIKRAIGE
jgi:hypothetical protein